MSTPKRIISAAFSVIMVLLLFTPISDAVALSRFKTAITQATAESDCTQSDNSLVSTDSSISLPGLGISEFSHPSEIDPEVPGVFNVYSFEHTWFFDDCEPQLVKAISSTPTFRSLSLTISSTSKRRISVCTTAIARSRPVTQIGVSQMLLQVYSNHRWMTVYGIGNDYTYGTTRYYMSTSRTQMSSGASYRVVATFCMRSGMTTSMITRISNPIICR